MIAGPYWRNSIDQLSNTFSGKQTNVLMHWLSLEPPYLLIILILLIHCLWWRTCWFLTRLSFFFIIDLLVVNLYKLWFTPKKKNKKLYDQLTVQHERKSNSQPTPRLTLGERPNKIICHFPLAAFMSQSITNLQCLLTH